MKKKAFQSEKSIPSAGQLMRPRDPGVVFFSGVNPDIIAYAPIIVYVRPWCDGRYSRQTLYRLLNDVADQESWHALCGVEEYRYLHSANCTLIEALLRALDEREVEVAA